MFDHLLPLGGQFLAQNEVWPISPTAPQRKLLPLDWEQGAFPPGRDMGSGELESCQQACLGCLRRTPNPGASAEGVARCGSLADRCGAACAGCGGLGRSAWWKPFPRAGQATASCGGWPRPPARWQGFPLCSRLGGCSDIPGPCVKLRPHWEKNQLVGGLRPSALHCPFRTESVPMSASCRPGSGQ